MKKYMDKENKFMEFFNPKNGFYLRTGVLKLENNSVIDTNIDPFMRDFPQLIDIGIMGNCQHGRLGLCKKGGVDCYQNGLGKVESNMSLNNFKKIVNECKDKTFQFALGGRGDCNKHENFKEILEFCVENEIVPNYTTSGLNLTEEEVKITKDNCGAVAVSWYRQEHTTKAISMFLNAGITTNIHYVLGNNSIDEAIERLKNNDFPKGINAIIFLLHKPIGLGTQDNVLKYDNPKLAEFFNIIDTYKFNFKIGFDSCSVPAIINFTTNINEITFDTCEAGRYSCYITSDMIMIPCSFENQNPIHGIDLNKYTVEEAWKSNKFNEFRNHFKNSCNGCKDKHLCLGGCPITREIVICNKKEKELM